jgi:hypothetical protein
MVRPDRNEVALSALLLEGALLRRDATRPDHATFTGPVPILTPMPTDDADALQAIADDLTEGALEREPASPVESGVGGRLIEGRSQSPHQSQPGR